MKKITNTKTAVELMLLPEHKAQNKANKRLFPVCNAIEEMSDSSSEEDNLICMAYDRSKQKDGFEVRKPELFNSSRMGSTRRGLLDSYKHNEANEAGEAYYDSERSNNVNIMEQVIDT